MVVLWGKQPVFFLCSFLLSKPDSSLSHSLLTLLSYHYFHDHHQINLSLKLTNLRQYCLAIIVNLPYITKSQSFKPFPWGSTEKTSYSVTQRDYPNCLSQFVSFSFFSLFTIFSSFPSSSVCLPVYQFVFLCLFLQEAREKKWVFEAIQISQHLPCLKVTWKRMSENKSEMKKKDRDIGKEREKKTNRQRKKRVDWKIRWWWRWCCDSYAPHRNHTLNYFNSIHVLVINQLF